MERKGRFGLAGILLGVTLALGSGCASTYNALPESAKGVIRGTPDILWPITWREAMDNEEKGEGTRRNVERLPEHIYRTSNGEYWPKSGYRWKNNEEGNYEVVPIE
ncbi:MAG: hypothetical protein ABIJ05_03570 [Patescibacteria group bacterium]